MLCFADHHDGILIDVICRLPVGLCMALMNFLTRLAGRLPLSGYARHHM